MKSTELCQVAYSSQKDWRSHDGSLEQPKKTYHAGQDQPYDNGTRPLELRQVPNRVIEAGERLVSLNDPSQTNGSDFYAHDLEMQPRRRPEMVIPSIERDLPDKQADQTSIHGKTRQVSPFGSYQSLNRGTQQLLAPPNINLDDYKELPGSKRRRIDDHQPVDSHSQGRTILVPIEQIDDRRLQYERPHEAVHRDNAGNIVSDKRIVPLPPKEERTRPPISRQVLQLLSPRTQMKRRPDQIDDRGERYPQPIDHYQVPLSRSENVENLQLHSCAVFAQPKYYNDSPFFFESSQFAPRYHESSDLGFSSRRAMGVTADSDQVYTDSDGMMRRLQPLEVAERSMPSRFSDMFLDYGQRDDDRRPDRVAYVPSTATADSYRHTNPSSGALTYSFATATDNVHGPAGHAVTLLTYALDTAKDTLHEDTGPLTNAYPRNIRERQPASTNFDHPPSRMQQLDGMPQRPVWSVQQNASSHHQLNQHHAKPDRANPFERHALPHASRVAMEPWFDTVLEDGIGLS